MASLPQPVVRIPAGDDSQRMEEEHHRATYNCSYDRPCGVDISDVAAFEATQLEVTTPTGGTEATRKLLGHQRSTVNRGVTDRYVGDEVEETWLVGDSTPTSP